MSQQLRQLSGLVDFECAARWCSFKLAAHELHKTPAAVSQNIKQLEQALGFTLFERHARHLSMTEKGSEFAATVSRLLQELNLKVTALREDSDNECLRISCTHSFSMKWLVPRLHSFTEQYPDIDIRIDSSDAVADLKQGGCDIAIRHQLYSNGEDGSLLWREQSLLACSPALLRLPGDKNKRGKAGKIPDIRQLLRYPLLYEGTPENWIRLLQTHSLLDLKPDYAQNYSHAGLLVQAAVAGQGIGLLPAAIAYEDIRQQRLLHLHGVQLSSPYCYRLLLAPGKAGLGRVKCFMAWLGDEMEVMRAILEER